MRKAAAIESDDLMKLLEDQMGEEGLPSLKEIVPKGDFKVDFDWENYEYQKKDPRRVLPDEMRTLLGPQKQGDLSFIGCMAGGDWEYPVYFIVYLDGDGKRLRVYTPSEGNAWNGEIKQAFGNNEVSDHRFLKRWCKENNVLYTKTQEEYDSDDVGILYNKQKFLDDIKGRIEVSGVPAAIYREKFGMSTPNHSNPCGEITLGPATPTVIPSPPPMSEKQRYMEANSTPHMKVLDGLLVKCWVRTINGEQVLSRTYWGDAESHPTGWGPPTFTFLIPTSVEYIRTKAL